MSRKKMTNWTPRCLKFKVWDCFNNKWIINWTKQVGKTTHICFLPEQMMKDGEGPTVQFFDSYNGSSYRFLQYTGLDDINDVEIYEGDIVKVTSDTNSYYNFIASIVFDKGSYYFKINDIDVRSGWGGDDHSVTVIGNICENEK